jgi:hypothetical protein
LLLARALTRPTFFLACAGAATTGIVQQVGMVIDPATAAMSAAHGPRATARTTGSENHATTFLKRAGLLSLILHSGNEVEGEQLLLEFFLCHTGGANPWHQDTRARAVLKLFGSLNKEFHFAVFVLFVTTVNLHICSAARLEVAAASEIITSVVSSKPALDAAFCKIEASFSLISRSFPRSLPHYQSAAYP